ncbi:hypothetical protein [Streptomyces sp. NBC_00986]|uniref:hypothetical protein n=1 Tax=Streptomyces sp. NBC_00986 TaxID=2903702 RepID=UPI003870214E|nr:hypothetical protein OG504_42820 [Streptomyces sp. NBC_00986]
MALETTLREPVQLTDPLEVEPPAPAPGCDVCGALLKQWRQATEKDGHAYDLSHATDLAVEIKRHPHAWQKEKRS